MIRLDSAICRLHDNDARRVQALLDALVRKHKGTIDSNTLTESDVLTENSAPLHATLQLRAREASK